MQNYDTMSSKQLEITQSISNAAKEGNTEAFEAGFQALFQSIHDQILDEAKGMKESADAAILAQRGVRQLTSEEKTWYSNLIESVKASGSGNAMMSLSNADKTFPVTIVQQVMEDMKQSHPLLAAVDTVNVTGATKLLLNADPGEYATWSALESAITTEIDSAFKNVDLTQFKLSAWMPISIDMLELGANWLDSYIRTCLSEALAIGFENAIVTGTGKDQPIGMDRYVAADVVIVGGVYPQKSAVEVTSFDRASYGALVALLAKNEQNKPRAVRDLILVVNPFDYFSIVLPATTILSPDGKYVNDVLPVPTQIIQSVAVTQGEAILGMGKKYFLGIGGKRGIQFSDDYKFLEDKRYYKTVAYANGLPKDNNAFLRLDISNLTPTYLEVKEVSF